MLAKLLAFPIAIVVATAPAQTFVRVRDSQTIRGYDSRGIDRSDPGATPRSCVPPSSFDLIARAWHGQAVPGGGTLSPLAPINPATINDGGRIAFIANVNGSSRNQGCFTADSGGLHVIARGCGGGGGSGDPGTGCGDASPIGGTFSGFFGGTVFAPPINDLGDVLFFADVFGGSSSRGLFLYQGDTGVIIKIAAVGDPSPIGGTIAAVGPGSMNNSREIVFLAQNSGGGNVNILKWSSGVITKHVAVGDAVPGGGTFQIIAGESFGFVDGTTIPIGDVPAINDAGDVSFFSTVAGASYGRGLFVTTGGVHTRYLRNGEATPMGGTYFDFQSPMLNNAGQIAFFADVRLSPSEFTSGWVVGAPGQWRKALAFFDSLDGGSVNGLAFSRNPMDALDDCGNLAMWCNVVYPNSSEREMTIISPPGAANVIVARQGDATPLGGTYTGMQAWPTMNEVLQGLVSAFTPGASGGALNTHFVYTGAAPCAPCDVNCDGSVNPFDIQLFINLLSGTGSACSPCAGDTDGNGTVNPFDINAFIACLGG